MISKPKHERLERVCFGRLKMLILVLLIIFFPWRLSSDTEIPESVSLVQLLATPERFDGKLIAVAGFLYIGFESDALYLHEEDFRNKLIQNSVRIERNKQIVEQIETLSDKYVVVIGAFQAIRHKDVTPHGIILRITKCALWSDPAKSRTKREK